MAQSCNNKRSFEKFLDPESDLDTTKIESFVACATFPEIFFLSLSLTFAILHTGRQKQQQQKKPPKTNTVKHVS